MRTGFDQRCLSALLALVVSVQTVYAEDPAAVMKRVALSRDENAPIDKTKLKSLVLPARSHFKVDPSYVSRHDVVYLTPKIEFKRRKPERRHE